MATSEIDAIADQIRDRGGRITPGVRRVLEIILASPVHHFAAADLVEAVRDVEPSGHESTVYRMLDRLVSYGVLDRVQLGTGAASYHFATQQHEHLFCEVCGAVIEAPRGLLDDLANRLRRDYDFLLRISVSPLQGTCGQCHSDI